MKEYPFMEFQTDRDEIQKYKYDQEDPEQERICFNGICQLQLYCFVFNVQDGAMER